jgi:phage gp46-like protein
VDAYDGDLFIYPTADGGDVNIQAGQPDMDRGLWTAVYLSLFSATGWWGNAIAETGGECESTLDDTMTGTLTPALRLDIEESARQALAWMITAGIASAVSVVATISAADRLSLAVTITQPAADPVTYKYVLNWAAQRVAMGVI